MIIDTLKADLTAARKEQNTTRLSILSTAIGEMMSKAVMVDGVKTVSDETAYKVLKNFIKGIDETIAIRGANTQLVAEREILDSYLPKMLSEDEISTILKDAKNGGKGTIGELMQHMKANYPNLYDGKTASKVANELLKG